MKYYEYNNCHQDGKVDSPMLTIIHNTIEKYEYNNCYQDEEKYVIHKY